MPHKAALHLNMFGTDPESIWIQTMICIQIKINHSNLHLIRTHKKFSHFENKQVIYYLLFIYIFISFTRIHEYWIAKRRI